MLAAFPVVLHVGTREAEIDNVDVEDAEYVALPLF